MPPTGLVPSFSKTKGNTYATLLHHPFLFKLRTNACSRASKKDFWRCCRGGLRSSQDIPSTHHKLLSLTYIICHFPLIFLSPTSPLPFYSPSFPFTSFPFASFCLPLACLCVGLFVMMAQDNTKLCDFSNTNNNDFISTPISPTTMLNLVKLIPLC